MTPQEIRGAILADPALVAIKADSGALAQHPTFAARTRVAPRMVTERGVASALGAVDGETFLAALETFAAANLGQGHPLKTAQPAIARQLAWLKRDGIDVGDALTRALLDTLAAAGDIEAAHAAAVKALAEVPDPVSEIAIRRAIWNDDGSPAV